MTSKVDFESVLQLVDQAISPTYLNSTQEIVLREVWNGKTYSKMACDYNYDPEYIKTVGCNLWQTLSRAFDEQINKSNFVPFMRQRLCRLMEETGVQPEVVDESGSGSVVDEVKPQFCNWTTAPDTQNFIGRTDELELLQSWSRESDCRLIVVTGMTGAGKTMLVTELANQVKQEFDCVIWFSLSQRPSLIKLLHRYLKIINPSAAGMVDARPQELSFLLSEFINCLRRQRILLVLDGLQCILELSSTTVSYKNEFEAYGQFLRSIISTNHQSLLVTTSRLKPKLLQYYANNQVKFLDLQGWDKQSTMTFLNRATSNLLAEAELLKLSQTVQNNPQLLQIAHSHLDLFDDDNAKQVIEDLSLLEAIKDLLEQELSCLSDVEREIVYWLATSCTPLSLGELKRQTKHSHSQLGFLRSIKSLIGRSLLLKENEQYVLMPIMKSYVRRKLIQQAL